jgi:erythromycin esterase
MIALSGDHQGVAAHSVGERRTDSSPGGSLPGAGGLSAAIRELDERSVALQPGSPLGFESAVFAPLDSAVAAARVVGLGEATHGTAEFFELKHRLFRYLVEAHGHRALGYEVGFAASLDLDRYVTTGEGSLDDLLGNLSWIQANEEVRALLEWMRIHNRGLPGAERVRFIGIDSQLDMWNLELHRQLFRERFPAISADLRPGFDILGEPGRIDYRRITRDEYDRIRSVLREMAGVVLRTSGGVDHGDRSIAIHLIEALQRSHEFLYSAYQGSNDVRDGHLAANALWIAGFLGDDAPFSVWAHNSHVGADPHFYGENGPGSMGFHLTRELGRAYFRVGTAFTRGAFVALRGDWRGKDTTAPLVCRLNDDPPVDSVNAVLGRARAERFYLQLREIPQGTSLHRFLDVERPMLGVGDFFAGETGPHYRSPERIIRALEALDVIFYFANTEGIQPLESTDAP